MKSDKCECCGKVFPAEELSELKDIDGEVTYEKICNDCRCTIVEEDEPNATVFYDDDEQPHFIGSYRNDTGGDFTVKWHNTDGWRGYFDVKSSDDWVQVHDDAILSYSEDERELKNFDDEFKRILKEKGIRYARVFTRTSNVFCSGYDFFVESGKEDIAKAIKVVLALKYRDPERFELTALTGKDPADWDERDRLFLKAVKLIRKGKSVDDALDELHVDLEDKED